MTATAQPDPARGKVWWVEFAPSIGQEIQKTRPAVVMNLDEMGALALRVVVPLTSWQEKFSTKPWMIFVARRKENGLENDCAADVFQLQSASLERFRGRLGTLAPEELRDVAAAIALVVGHEMNG